MSKIVRAVFVAFIKEDKLLVVKSVRSARHNLYTLVGGTVLEHESIFEGAVRECKEEINQDFQIKQRDFVELFKFDERAISNPKMLIEFNLLYSKKEIDIEIKPDLEILDYKWVDVNETDIILSTTITKYIIPWMKEGSYKSDWQWLGWKTKYNLE